jgi:hypothetical protein
MKERKEKLMEKMLQQLKKGPMTKGELRNHIFFGIHNPASLLSALQEKSLIASQRRGRTHEYYLTCDPEWKKQYEEEFDKRKGKMPFVDQLFLK